MANLREIAFDIDFAKKKAYNNQDITLEELTQNDHNSSVLVLRLLQDEQPIDLTGITVVLNFLLPDGSDYKIDIAQSHNINTRTSLVTYSIPKMVLSQVGVVIGTVSLYKAGYRYTSIVQFKFEVVEDIVNDGEIVDSENYPILVSMISDINMIHADEEGRKIAEEGRINAELERIEAEDEREVSEATRTLSELERQESEEGRVLAESNRELLESERQKAELLRIASISEMEANEMIRVEGESLRVSSELERKESELNRANAESVRAENEANRMSSEESRCKAEEDRVNAELLREQKQNEFNARAEEVAVRIEEESQRISDLVEIEESKLVKPGDMVDYMGNRHNSLKEKADSDVDYAVKTAIGEFNYLDYEGQHITATNSIEGHARSAILKGNTLVNIPTTITEYYITNKNYGGWVATFEGSEAFVKPNTKYYIGIFNNSTETKTYGLRIDPFITGKQITINANSYGFLIETTVESITSSALVINKAEHSLDNDVKILFIEHQEGMENWDIPYFEGMQSVRMPVLTTTGKNLFDGSAFYGSLNGGTGAINSNPNGTRLVTTNAIKLVANKPYSISAYDEDDSRITFVREIVIFSDKECTNRIGQWGNRITKATYIPNQDCYIRFTTLTVDNNDVEIRSDLNTIAIQIEEGSTPTSYEPYKTNILSCNEEVELCSVGDVYDTLDLLTGEVVNNTKDINLKYLYANWLIHGYSNDDFILAYGTLDSNGVRPNTQFICEKIPFHIGTAETLRNQTSEFIWRPSTGSQIYIWLKRDKLKTQDGNGLYEFFSTNDYIVKMVMPQSVNKTVDLSDNVVYSYDGTTHYSCSSEEGSLVPTLSVKVPTDVQATIAQQRNTIVALEAENEALKEGQMLLESGHEHQEGEIISTQDAVNFLLFGEVGLMMLRLQEEQSKEMDKMAVYIANQILKRKVSYELAVSKYPQFKEDIDSILIMEGREDLIQG